MKRGEMRCRRGDFNLSQAKVRRGNISTLMDTSGSVSITLILQLWHLRARLLESLKFPNVDGDGNASMWWAAMRNESKQVYFLPKHCMQERRHIMLVVWIEAFIKRYRIVLTPIFLRMRHLIITGWGVRHREAFSAIPAFEKSL